MLRIEQLQVFDGLQRDAVGALGAAVENEDVHGKPPFSYVVFLYYTVESGKKREGVFREAITSEV